MKLVYIQIAILLAVAVYYVESKACHLSHGCGCGGLKAKLGLLGLKGPCGHPPSPCGCGKPLCGCHNGLLGGHCGIKGLICKELYGGTSCPFCHGTGCTTCNSAISVGKSYPYVPPVTLPPVVLPPVAPTTYKYTPPATLPAPEPYKYVPPAKPCEAVEKIIVNVVNPPAPVPTAATPVYPVVLPTPAPEPCITCA